MPYPPDHKEQTRRKIVKTAARLFNRKGFSEVTIGEIMMAVGLTHGGFYRHFRSKDELFAETVSHFIHKEARERWQKRPVGSTEREPDQPFARFVADAYLSRDHLEDVGGSCPLIGVSSDVARSGQTVKAAYREVAEKMVRVFEAGLKGPGARAQALVSVTLCVGGMVLARAIDDQVLADDFRNAANQHIQETSLWRGRRTELARRKPTNRHRASDTATR